MSGFSLGWAIDGGVDRALRDASARGVRVRMVTEVTGAMLGDSKHFASFSDMRHAAAPVTNRAIVVTGSARWCSCRVRRGWAPPASPRSPSGQRLRKFIARTRQYHQRLWGRGTPAEQRIVELESPPGASLAVVQGHLAEPFQRLREITELGMRATVGRCGSTSPR